jgi:hypothetical protein
MRDGSWEGPMDIYADHSIPNFVIPRKGPESRLRRTNSVRKDSKVPVCTPLIQNELARHSRLSYRTDSQPAAQVEIKNMTGTMHTEPRQQQL